jgi:hypothetical protein
MPVMPRRIALLVAWLVPAWWLFDRHAAFSLDWGQNLWMTGYCGAYWRAHGVLPMTFNSASGVGSPLPLFYGYVLYPLLAPLAAFLGSALALRCGILAVLALQVHAGQAAVKHIIPHWRVGFAITLSAVWSIYALTDLYNRSALPEYFASSLSVAAVGYLVAATSEPQIHRGRFFGWLAALCGLLAAGSHPPTAAMTGIVMVGAVGVLGAMALGRGKLRRGYASLGGAWAAAVVSAVILIPWIELKLLFLPQLSAVAPPGPLMYLRDRCDTWLGRFSLLPYDPTRRLAPAAVSTPFLEATVSGGLLILLIWTASLWWRLRRAKAYPVISGWERSAPAMFGVSILGFAWLTLASLPVGAGIWPEFLSHYIQFGYRLVTPANLALLLGVLAAGSAAARRGAFKLRRRETTLVATGVLLFTGLGVMIKLGHAGAIRGETSPPEYGFGGDRAPIVTRGNDYLDSLHGTPGMWPALSAEDHRTAAQISLPVDATAEHFGRVSAAQLDQAAPGWCVTNITAFAWSALKVNGRFAQAGELEHWENHLAVRVPAGHSTIEWSWQPDRRWLLLHRLGRWTLVVALAVTALWALAIKQRMPSLGV